MPFRPISLSYAYSFADRVVQAVSDAVNEPYLEDFLDPEDPGFFARVARPHRDTLLHWLIRNLNQSVIEYDTGHFLEESAGGCASMLYSVGLPVPDWLLGDEVHAHVYELDALMAQATELITEATFQLLFSDREFLGQFQTIVAGPVARHGPEEFPKYYRRHGVLRRPPRIPAWLNPAVFHRDKGMCQACLCDLTNRINLETTIHIDHIRSLSQSGSNDPTNFQLLCEPCNLKKSGATVRVSARTATYW